MHNHEWVVIAEAWEGGEQPTVEETRPMLDSWMRSANVMSLHNGSTLTMTTQWLATLVQFKAMLWS